MGEKKFVEKTIQKLNIKSIKPMFTQVITTTNTYDEDQMDGVVIDINRRKGTLKEYQKVVAVGPSVRNIQVGDLVKINPIRYSKKKHQEGSLKDGIISDNPVVDYLFNVLIMDHKKYLMLQDNDIDFVIDDYSLEEEKIKVPITTTKKFNPKKSNLILPDNQIMV